VLTQAEYTYDGDGNVIEMITRDRFHEASGIGPYRTGDQKTVADFGNFFKSPYVTRHPITADVCEQAARLRAQFNFKLPDALNLAAAAVYGCDRNLTNDARLTRCTSITVEVLS